eukprot:GHVL01020831.1.p1 GENE.GHVL01020831.1~~GHVL01020831.1.p1  ORF type:complete len:194 (+),score=10.90 GHVL01020831.1:158-739(+)
MKFEKSGCFGWSLRTGCLVLSIFGSFLAIIPSIFMTGPLWFMIVRLSIIFVYSIFFYGAFKKIPRVIKYGCYGLCFFLLVQIIAYAVEIAIVYLMAQKNEFDAVLLSVGFGTDGTLVDKKRQTMVLLVGFAVFGVLCTSVIIWNIFVGWSLWQILDLGGTGEEHMSPTQYKSHVIGIVVQATGQGVYSALDEI